MEGATNRGDAHFPHQKQGVSGGVAGLDDRPIRTLDGVTR